jgi:hypothetical protein
MYSQIVIVLILHHCHLNTESVDNKMCQITKSVRPCSRSHSEVLLCSLTCLEGIYWPNTDGFMHLCFSLCCGANVKGLKNITPSIRGDRHLSLLSSHWETKNLGLMCWLGHYRIPLLPKLQEESSPRVITTSWISGSSWRLQGLGFDIHLCGL